ncbi:MAG: ABC transporter substrate-binding protein [Planctomycetota bacterium]|jgi:peptide/nickel transport system substrate-binding protein
MIPTYKRLGPAMALFVFAAALAACPSSDEGENGQSAADRFASAPIGTGAYSLGKWDRDQRIILKANPEYWGGPAKTETVIVTTVKENSSRRQQLESGDVHAIDGVNPIDVGPLREHEDLDVLEQTGMSVAYLALNTRKEQLADPRVRRAISLAVDRERIVALNFQGSARQARQVTPEGVLAPASGLEVERPNHERARQLLEAAGFKDGLDLELWAMPNPRPYLPEPKKTAEILKQDLAKIGVRCTIVTHPWGSYLDKTQKGEHDLCLLGWTLDVADPDNTLFTFFSTANHDGTNVSYFGDEGVDKLLLEAQAEAGARSADSARAAVPARGSSQGGRRIQASPHGASLLPRRQRQREGPGRVRVRTRKRREAPRSPDGDRRRVDRDLHPDL